ncbi:MAG: hypothetical protein J0G32_01210 [Alphaproteobacteria bacterium]|nr:hypothetical protein [Alphaproteobacteria bacterium]OJV15273.1 MAG: hypothetical protein BGO27_02055 [Alphaproteobacteria bacterium 33-17]
MKTTKDEAKIINKALDYWNKNGLINDQTKQKLGHTIIAENFAWKSFSKYSSIIAVVCFVIVVMSIGSTETVINALLFPPHNIKAIILTILSLAILSKNYFSKSSSYTNVIINFLGLVTSLLGFYHIFKTAIFDQTTIFLLCGIYYLAIAHFINSMLIGYVGWSFLACYPIILLQIPTNFIPEFSLIINVLFFGIGVLSTNINYILSRSAIICSAIGIFIATIFLAIFPNNTHLLSVFGSNTKYFWAIINLGTSILSLIVGAKLNNTLIRRLGFVFTVLSAFMLYFFVFWTILPQMLFFLFIGLIFWIVATYSEQYIGKF